MPPESANPPRGKKKKKPPKGKTSGAPADVLSTEDMSKQQLEEHVIRLREELEREREESSFFQLERDKIRSSWEVSQRHLQETRAQLAHRGREKDDAERRHRLEISVYRQKLKAVLSEQRAVDKKTDGGAAGWLARRRHADAELRLRRLGQNAQADAGRDKLGGYECIRELKLKHQVELMELSNEYQKRISEVEAKYAEKVERMRRAESEKTWAAISALEDTMRRRLESLTDERRRKFGAAREFFGAAQSKLAHDGRSLGGEASAARTRRGRVDARLDEARKHNARLAASLREAERDLPDLRRRLDGHRRARSRQAAGAARVKQLEEELEDVVLERDLLIAAFAQVEEERDALLSKQTDVLLEVRQRSGLKEMLLDRKMAFLSHSADRKEARLLAALARAGDAVPDQLRGTLESERDAIATAREDRQVCGTRRVDVHDGALVSLQEGACRRNLDALGVSSSVFPPPDAQLILDRHVRTL